MHATVHVGVGVVVFVGDGLHHLAGLLRGGAVVQVDQGLAVDGAAQDGEVGAYLVDVVHKGFIGLFVTFRNVIWFFSEHLYVSGKFCLDMRQIRMVATEDDSDVVQYSVFIGNCGRQEQKFCLT